MSRILVTGGDSGLGAAIISALQRGGSDHVCFSFDFTDDVRDPKMKSIDQLRDIDILINCAGINRIGYLEDFKEDDWDHVMDVNAKGIYMMAKALLPELIRSKGTILNIVSNASHMPMTGSLAYCASKAAAHMMTLQLARELTKRYGITVFGIAPNKLIGTGMSKYIEDAVPKVRGWTKEYATQYQLNGLLTGEETPPEALAEFIAFLLSSKERHKYLSGCILPYGS